MDFRNLTQLKGKLYLFLEIYNLIKNLKRTTYFLDMNLELGFQQIYLNKKIEQM